MGDLTSRRWIVAKGIMFAVIVVMSGAGVLIHEDVWFRLGLLLVCLWAACRFYCPGTAKVPYFLGFLPKSP